MATMIPQPSAQAAVASPSFSSFTAAVRTEVVLDLRPDDAGAGTLSNLHVAVRSRRDQTVNDGTPRLRSSRPRCRQRDAFLHAWHDAACAGLVLADPRVLPERTVDQQRSPHTDPARIDGTHTQHRPRPVVGRTWGRRPLLPAELPYLSEDSSRELDIVRAMRQLDGWTPWRRANPCEGCSGGATWTASRLQPRRVASRCWPCRRTRPTGPDRAAAPTSAPPANPDDYARFVAEAGMRYGPDRGRPGSCGSSEHFCCLVPRPNVDAYAPC
jgi:hypothetical protein